MSKILNTYHALKEKDSSVLYLFKSGAFYIAVEDDAKKLADLFNFKITKLNDSAIKCGFPLNSFEKYNAKLEWRNIPVKVIENDTIIEGNPLIQNKEIKDLLKLVSTIDFDKIGINEIYNKVEICRKKAIQILGRSKNE